MKISLKWLNEYVDVSEFFSKPGELDAILTAAGLEVENMENFSERFQNVVIGHVVELGKHPDADKLTLCKVNTGEKELRQIVCGAKNHKQGDKVVVAVPGAVLPGNFAIKKSKIRGVESLGMMCSETELGLADEAEGILILPEDAPVGMAFAEYKDLDDVVFELSVTPNRADCLSHVGLAREVACLLGRELTLPEIKIKGTKGKTKGFVDVELKAVELCPRYAGRAIRGIKVGPSPTWLKTRLESVGINSINNVVDVTNYVMLEMGQPLHAFDVGEIDGGKIVVDYATKGEKFTTLDGTEIELSGEELMIHDGKRPVALAGVVGGLNSGVTDKSQDLFIESAHFAPETVRRTARKFGIETDSAYRFSRGTDPEGVVKAMNRACELIQQLAGGEVAEDHHDVYPSPIQKEAIEITQKTLEERLGYPVNMDEFVDWMQRLDCTIDEEMTSGSYMVQAPAFRWDLHMDMDLVEEFARLHGYDEIPETMPVLAQEPTDHDKAYVFENRLANILSSEGFLQSVNYNFVGAEFQAQLLGGYKGQKDPVAALGVELYSEPIQLVNPLSEDLNVMRSSLMPGLVKNLLHNYRHGSLFGRIFEIGVVISASSDGKAKEFIEQPRLGLMAWGQRRALWDKAEDRPVVYDIKAAIENMLKKLNGNSWQWRNIEKQEIPQFLHPGQSAGLFFEGRVVGYVGTLHPSLQQEYKLRHDCAVAEIDVEKIMRGQPKLPKLKKISKYPLVERDFAFVIPNDLAVGEVIRQIKKIGGNLLQSVEIFDVYTGDKVAEGQRSVAFRLVYQDDQGTLSDESLTQMQGQLLKSLSQHFAIEVR